MPKSRADVNARFRAAAAEGNAVVLEEADIREALGVNDSAVKARLAQTELRIRQATIDLKKREIIQVPPAPTVDPDPFKRDLFKGVSDSQLSVFERRSETKPVNPGQLLTVHGQIGGPLILPHRRLRCLLMRVEHGEVTDDVIGDITITQGGEMAWTDGTSKYSTPPSAALVVHPDENPCEVTFIDPLNKMFVAGHADNELTMETADVVFNNIAAHFSGVLDRQDHAAKALGFSYKPGPYTSIDQRTLRLLRAMPGSVTTPLERWVSFVPYLVEKDHPQLRGPKIMVAQGSGWICPYQHALQAIKPYTDGMPPFVYLSGETDLGPVPDSMKGVLSNVAVALIRGKSVNEPGYTTLFEQYGIEEHDRMNERDAPPAVYFPNQKGGSVLSTPLPDLSHPEIRTTLQRLRGQQLIMKAASTAADMSQAAQVIVAAAKDTPEVQERTGWLGKLARFWS